MNTTGVPVTEGQPARVSWPRRHKTAILIAGGVLAAIVTAVAIFALRAATSPIIARGDMQVQESCASAGTDYPDISADAQVIVTDSAGKVLATSALGSGTSAGLPGGFGGICNYPFTVTIPSGQPRYGIIIGHNRGTVWFSADQMKQGPGLSLSSPPPAF